VRFTDSISPMDSSEGVPAVGRHRWSLPDGSHRQIRAARSSSKRGPGPAHRSGPGQGGPPASPRDSFARLRQGPLKVYDGADRRNVLRFTRAGEQGPHQARGRCALPAGSQPELFVASRVSPHPPVVPSNGRAPEVGRRGPAAIGYWRNSPGTSIAARHRAGSVTSFAADLRSIPTAAPPPASAAARCPLG
jgi:hypothetical protein